MSNPVVTLRAKCTTCGKFYDMTEVHRREAEAIGCAFSPCCFAVAIVTRVEVKQPTKRGARNG